VVLALVCGALLASAVAIAAAEDVASSGAGEPKSDTIKLDPLDEIIIKGHRAKLRELRQEIEKAEDAFYDAFNEVNTVPEYRTYCGIETATGTRISTHVCKPEFVNSATKGDLSTFLYELGVTGGHPERASGSVINEKMAGYWQHIQDLLRKDPKLRKALSHYCALTVRYQAEFEEKRKGKWFFWD